MKWMRIRNHACKQCCGSMIFWYESGSGYPYLWLMDPDPDTTDSVIFVCVLQDKKLLLFLSFFHDYFLNVHLNHFLKIKSPKEVTKQYKSMFFLLFLLDDRRIRIRIWIHISLRMDPDPGGSKIYGPYGSGSATLPLSFGALSSCTQENEKNSRNKEVKMSEKIRSVLTKVEVSLGLRLLQNNHGIRLTQKRACRTQFTQLDQFYHHLEYTGYSHGSVLCHDYMSSITT